MWQEAFQWLQCRSSKEEAWSCLWLGRFTKKLKQNAAKFTSICNPDSFCGPVVHTYPTLWPLSVSRTSTYLCFLAEFGWAKCEVGISKQKPRWCPPCGRLLEDDTSKLFWRLHHSLLLTSFISIAGLNKNKRCTLPLNIMLMLIIHVTRIECVHYWYCTKASSIYINIIHECAVF